MSYNSLFGLGSNSEDASLEGWWPLQDNAASTAVDDVSSNNNNGTLAGGDNTADITTTGPNSWLTAALDLDGAADYVLLSDASSFPAGDNARTIAAHFSTDAFAVTRTIFRQGPSVAPAPGTQVSLCTQSTGIVLASAAGRYIAAGGELSTGTWYHAAIVVPDSATMFLDMLAYINGTAKAISLLSGSDVTINTTSTNFSMGAEYPGVSTNYFDGRLAGISVFSRELSATEVAELAAGPEPINTVAPALSGTELVGETLTATSGTWALDAPFSGGSNGTVTYSYQWTRSDDDSGTNEADISGATSSTYVLTASDAGKYVRCRVRGTNDGGFDANADTETAMSGKIATTALLANLEAHYRLDETSGTVMRNEVRTLLLDDDFDSGSTSGTYGDVPTGWAEYRASSPATHVTTYNAGSDTLTLELDGEGTGAGIGGIQKTSFLTVGKRYVLRTRFRVTEAVTGGPFLVASAGSSVFYDLTTPTVGEWLTVDVNLGSASSTTFTYGVQVSPNTEAATVEIDSITIYEENAGTYDRDASNTTTAGQGGSLGTAYDANGTSDDVVVGSTNLLRNVSASSVSLWLKGAVSGSNMRLLRVNSGGSGERVWLRMLANGTVQLGARAGDAESAQTKVIVDNLGDDTWHHIAMVTDYANDTLIAYVDGELATLSGATPAFTATATSDTASTYTTIASSNGSEFFGGTIDDVRLYSRALSPTEITAVYDEGFAKLLSRTSIGLGIGL